MPCMDYEGDILPKIGYNAEKEYKARLDKLARIACKALTELEKFSLAYDRLISTDDEVATWWKKHKADDARAKALAKSIAMDTRIKAQIKQEALAKLSDEEKLVLGLIEPTIDEEEDDE